MLEGGSSGAEVGRGEAEGEDGRRLIDRPVLFRCIQFLYFQICLGGERPETCLPECITEIIEDADQLVALAGRIKCVQTIIAVVFHLVYKRFF